MKLRMTSSTHLTRALVHARQIRDAGLPHGSRQSASSDFQPTDWQRCSTSRHVSPSDGHNRHLSRNVCQINITFILFDNQRLQAPVMTDNGCVETWNSAVKTRKLIFLVLGLSSTSWTLFISLCSCVSAFCVVVVAYYMGHLLVKAQPSSVSRKYIFYSVDKFVRSFHLMIHQLLNWLTDSMIHWLTDSFTHYLRRRLASEEGNVARRPSVTLCVCPPH